MKFENGTLVKGAYVTIDGVDYEVYMPEYSGNTPLSAETFNKMQEDIFPVGSIYRTTINKNPNEILGFGTWERIKGKFLVGLDEDDPDFNEAGKIGGSKKHKHKQTLNFTSEYIEQNGLKYTSGDTVPTEDIYTEEVSNVPPYEVTGYVWIRTA